MLQPHSFLWHYLWVGPHVLQAILAVVLWRRGTHKRFRFFFAYLIYEASEELTLWLLDWLPGISAEAWWSAFCAGAVIEGLLKFAFVLELFLHLVRSRPTEAKLGKLLIGCTGAVLVALAAWAAAHAPVAATFPLSSYGHILGQTIFMIYCGLLLFIFLFAAYYHVAWNSWSFGIAVGASTTACVHLATWAVFANIGWFAKGYLLDFLNMATYHVCVLIWCYYLLSPVHPSTATVAAVSETKTDAPNSANIRMLGPRVLPVES
ncbi:MAG: hypothetical protein WBC78_16920 [Candidatus Sulfotelmatobacter sp.]